MDTKIDYEKIFNMFCTGSEHRESLRSPFKQNDIYFSTDAVAMIYMPAYIEELEFKEQYEVNVQKIIPLIFHEELALDVTKLDDAIKSLIPMIDEWKTIYKTCLGCDGDGELTCNLGHSHDCDGCGGTGEIPHKQLSEFKIPNQDIAFRFNGMEGYNIGFAYKQLARLIAAAVELKEKTIFKIYGTGQIPHIFKVGKTNILIMPAISNETDTILLPFDFHYQPIQS